MSNSNWIGNVALGITISKENITNDLKNAFKNLQQEADQHNITYKIAGDKSNLEAMLKQLQGMSPELLTKMKLSFDKSDYDKEMSLLKNVSGKTADQIGKDFKTSITSSLKGFSINEIIGKELGKNDTLNVKDIAKLKDALQGLMNQTGNFDLSKATSVGEINNQVIALNKMKVILESLSKYSDQKSIKLDGKSLNIAEMLQSNTSKIDSIMSNVGSTIKTNASQWSTTLETTFNNEFNNIIALFNHLKEIISGTFKSGDGSCGMFGQAVGDMKDLQVEIDKTTQEIEELESKLTELQNKKNSTSKKKENPEDVARRIASVTEKAYDEYSWDGKGKNLDSFKNLVNEYMQLGGKIEKLTLGARNLAKSLKIKQIVPQDVNKEIETLTRSLDEARKKKEELLGRQQTLSSGTGAVTGQGAGTGSGTGGQGTPVNAIVSPTLTPTFKEDLQKLVDATGSVNATVSGKLSETFLGDLQSNADSLGTIKVGVDFGKKEGTQSQEIPVDVVTTPKLSETFQGDLQKLIDGTGKYTVTVNANKDQKTDLVPIKTSVENGEEFRNQLKQAVEGESGLDVKVKPVIDTDFKLEINNAVLKDVKVEGSIQGGNLKPDYIEVPTGSTTPAITPSSTVNASDTSSESVKKELEEVKQGHEEVGKAAEKSVEVQKRSLFEVAKELSKAREQLDEWIHRSDSSRSGNEMSQFVEQKKQQAQEYSNIQELIAKIQSKTAESSSNSATNTDKIKHLAGIVAYVERLQELMGNTFSYNVLGENGEEQFKLMKQAVDQASGSIDDAAKKVRELNLQVRSLQDEKSALEKTATEAEKLEVKLYEAVKAIEALKNKKGAKYDSFVNLYDKYKKSGGTSDISAFTSEKKVIDEVTKSYNALVAARKSTAAETKLIYEIAHPNIDMNQFDSIFKQIETGALTAKKATEKLDVAIKALKAETKKPVNNPVNPETGVVTPTTPEKPSDQKPLKLDAKGEINVVPKVEDPAAFAGQVTEQLKGQSAIIDVKPIFNVNNNNISTEIANQDTLQSELQETIGLENDLKTLLEKSFTTSGKADATKQLKEAYATYKPFFENKDQVGNISAEGAKAGYAYYKSFEEAVRQGISRNNLEKYSIEKSFSGNSSYLERYSTTTSENFDDLLTTYTSRLQTFSSIVDEVRNKFGNIDFKFNIAEGIEGVTPSSFDTIIGSINDYVKAVEHLNYMKENQQAPTYTTGFSKDDIDIQIDYVEILKKDLMELASLAPKLDIKEKLKTDVPNAMQDNASNIKPIQIPVEANIESLNTSLQSKKDQILPVDVKVNAVPTTNTSTNAGTTGMAYETGEAEALRKKIVEVTTAVDNKTNAFRQEEQVVNGTVQSEITMLEVLDGQLNIILQDIQRIIDKPLKVNVDYSSIEQLSQADENGKSSIDKLKASINGLQTEVLKDLGESFKTLKINENTASRITELSTALETLKETLSNIDPNSTGFLNTIKDLAKEANGLKDLATVIRASKEEIQKVQTTIAQQKSGSSVSTFNVAIGTEEWDVAIKRAEKYKDVIGEIKKITYNFRKDSDGKYYKSFSFTGTKGKAVEGKNGELLYGNENKDLNVATNKTAQQMDNLITKFEEAAKKAKLVYDVGSLRINDDGVITFTTTVEELGNKAVTTKYKIEDLNNALNKDGSLSKGYLNSHSDGKLVKDLTGEYTAKDKEALITATQQAIEWEERENAYLKERNKLLAEGKAQEKAYYDASNKERENYTKFWENSLLKQDQKSLDNRKEDLSASYSQADENVKRENKYLEERNRLLKEGEAQSKAYYDTQNKERESYIKFWEKSLLKQDQKSLDGRKEDLSTVYSNADENVKRENEYLEKRNQLLVEGKAQEKAYYDAVNKERENYIKFWEKSLLKQDQESLKIRGVDTEALNTALQKTKISMDQVFAKKQNISGFQSVFDRAQAEVDELNKKLEAGQISNIQTGYTDKINKIVAGLNNVIGVTNPFDTASATEAMKAYADTINNGNVKIGNFTNSNKVLNVSFEEQKGVLREVALVYNEVSGAISYVDKGTKKVKSALTSFMDGIKARFKSLIQYLTIFVSYYRIIGMIKEGVQVVRDLDTALTEMRKVSDESVESLRSFQDVSFDIAKSVGTTAKQIQNSTADWMGFVTHVPLHGNM